MGLSTQMSLNILEVRRRVMMAQPHIETLVGNPVSFKAEALPLQELKVAITPVQDLHGQDSPYPPGGGKNLIPPIDGSNLPASGTVLREFATEMSFTGLTISMNFSGSFVNVGGSFIQCINENGNSTFICTPGYLKDNNGNALEANTVYTNKFVKFSSAATYAIKKILFYRYPSFTDAVFGDLQLEEGTTATSFAPYSNICPISGHTGLTAYNDPVYGGSIEWNQLIKNGDFADGLTNWIKNTQSDTLVVADGAATMTLNSIPVNYYGHNIQQIITNGTASHKYFISAYVKSSVTGTVSFGITNSTSASTLFKSVVANKWTQIGNILNITGAYSSVQISPGNNYAEYGVGDTISIKDVFVVDLTRAFGNIYATQMYDKERSVPGSGVSEVRSLFPKPYYPYNAGTPNMTVSEVNGDPYGIYPITWETAAGTVYGGTLDVVNGVLTVDRAIAYLSALGWNYRSNSGSEAFYTTLTGCDFGTENRSICSAYNFRRYITGLGQLSSLDTGEYAFFKNGAVLYMRNTNYTDENSFTASLTGQTFVYPLATPVTYQLSAQQISSLLGQNNLWNDINGDNTVSFYTH